MKKATIRVSAIRENQGYEAQVKVQGQHAFVILPRSILEYLEANNNTLRWVAVNGTLQLSAGPIVTLPSLSLNTHSFVAQ